jgi:Right handed beta helix region
MYQRLARTMAMILVLVALHGSMYAITRVVGPPACRPSLPHFSTIQSAIDASGMGDTVLVCPGNYQEQLTIAIPLNLEGIPYQGLAAVVITAPARVLGVQVLVQNTTKVTLSNLIVDGTGGYEIGMKFDYVGLASDSTSCGHINNVVVRNFLNLAIESNTSCLVIQSSDIHGAQTLGLSTYNGTSITVRDSTFRSLGVALSGGSVSFSGNTVIGEVSFLNINGSNISNNTIVSDYPGLTLSGSNNKIIGNTVIGKNNNFSGIEVAGGGNTISGNHITGFTVGAAIYATDGNSFVRNVLTNTMTAIYVNDYAGISKTPTVVTNNTINEATCGVSLGGVGTIYTPNTFHNVTTATGC